MNLFSSGHQVKEINFDICPENARKFANNCVRSITQNRIQDILPSNSINSNTDAILLNVIYCKGRLNHSFELDLTPDISVRRKIKKNKKHSANKTFNNGQ